MSVVTLNQTNVNVSDTWIVQNLPTTNYGTNNFLNIGNQGSSPNMNTRALIKFDLGLIPNDAIINSATLNFKTSAINNRTINIHKITSNWDANTATWNLQPSFDSNVYSSKLVNTVGAVSFDVKSLVQEWVNGTVNYGFLLKDSNEAVSVTTSTGFYSTEDTTASNRPTLTIDYTIPSTGKKQVEYVGNGGLANNASSASITPNIPAGKQAGDLLIAHVAGGISAFSIPNGWTQLLTTIQSVRILIAYKFAQATETNPTFTNDANVGKSAVIHAFRNVKAINNSVQTNFTSVTSIYPTAGTLSSTVQKAMLLLLNYEDNSYAITQPLSHTEITELAGSAGRLHGSYKYLHTVLSQISADMTTTIATAAGANSVGIMLEPIVNNVPTDPSNATVDKSSYTVGDTITINFTGSTDADGDAITYEADMYDGVSTWTNIATGKAGSPVTAVVPAMLDTVSAKVRVRARDAKGDPSNDVQSATFSVAQKDGQITAPVNVVSSAYLVSQMARPVMLSNKWLVGAVKDSGGVIYLYKSTDNGRTFTQVTTITNPSGTMTGFSFTSLNTKVYLIRCHTDVISRYIIDLATDSAFTGLGSLDTSLTNTGECTVAVSPDKTKLWWGANTKNATYPNSFNIRAGSIPINADGTLGTPSAVMQVTTENNSSENHINPFMLFNSLGQPVLIWANNKNANTWRIQSKNLTTLSSSDVYSSGNNSYTQSSPTGCNTPNGKQHVAWHGTDSTDTINAYIRYSNATTGTDWLATPKKLVKGQNATITSDKNGKLFITYEDAGVIKRIESTDEFATWTAPVTVGAGTKPTSLFDQSFALDFTVPPTIYQASGAVKYFGSYNVNTAPTLTLTNPANNQTLSEGNSYQVDGSATDTDNGNVITIKYKINNGTTRALNSGVSNGNTPISFAKTLTFHDKRLWDGTTDITGADLAEGTNHTLTVWVEDDQGGVSSQVTRTFTVIWNRPPTISGTDQNLGTINAIPTGNYSVTEPENDTFTITEYLDGVQTKSFAGVAGQNYSATIDPSTWLTLALDVPHEIRIRATDSKGLYSERVYTFTRTETQIKFELNLDDPATKAFFTDSTMPSRILVTLDAVILAGASITKVEVTNNAFDAAPTWEDATGPAKAGRGYLFTNKTKTAPNWGVNIRVTIDKGTATDRVIINGFGGAFD